MARTKAVLGSGARLADFLSASLLGRVVPAEVVNEVLNAQGCNSQRLRSEIGAAPLRDLVERCCVPMAEEHTQPGAFYAGLHLVAVEGSCFRVA